MDMFESQKYSTKYIGSQKEPNQKGPTKRDQQKGTSQKWPRPKMDHDQKGPRPKRDHGKKRPRPKRDHGQMEPGPKWNHYTIVMILVKIIVMSIFHREF